MIYKIYMIIVYWCQFMPMYCLRRCSFKLFLVMRRLNHLAFVKMCGLSIFCGDNDLPACWWKAEELEMSAYVGEFKETNDSLSRRGVRMREDKDE